MPIDMTSDDTSFVGRFQLYAGDTVESCVVAIGTGSDAVAEVAALPFRLAADNGTIAPVGLSAVLPDAMQFDLVPPVNLMPTYVGYRLTAIDPVTGAASVLHRYVFDHSLPAYMHCDESTRDLYFQVTPIAPQTFTGHVALIITRPARD